ncbi:hypothetical protein [Micromonospora kangleipakensis]|uniref:hypothetical protein n=1 Tax=Micromonospora kangleipakensis TaxID=1077942 RepID=UPI00102A81D5|nr:hypothetical protein [Micromonospora kangleipakensis]
MEFHDDRQRAKRAHLCRLKPESAFRKLSSRMAGRYGSVGEPRLGTPEQQLVPAMLAVNGARMAMVDELVHELWAEPTPTSAVVNVRTFSAASATFAERRWSARMDAGTGSVAAGLPDGAVLAVLAVPPNRSRRYLEVYRLHPFLVKLCERLRHCERTRQQNAPCRFLVAGLARVLRRHPGALSDRATHLPRIAAGVVPER